jgi:hypothetical protein
MRSFESVILLAAIGQLLPVATFGRELAALLS